MLAKPEAAKQETNKERRRDKENQKDGNYLLGLIAKSRCLFQKQYLGEHSIQHSIHEK